MLFGLLDDNTTIYNDPAKAALYGAGLGLMNTQGVTGRDFLGSAIGGAAAGYANYNKAQIEASQREQEQLQKMLEMRYKLAQTQQLEMQLRKAREEEEKQRREEEKKLQKKQQLNNFIDRYYAPSADGQPNMMGDLLRALPPEEAYKELGEIGNEERTKQLNSNVSIQALQNLMAEKKLSPVTQQFALELFNNNPDKAAGYNSVYNFLKDSGTISDKDNLRKRNLTAWNQSVDELVWATPTVKEAAKQIGAADGPSAGDNYLKAQMDLRKRLNPEDENLKMLSGGGFVMKNVVATQGKDGLYYDQNGQILPGGRFYTPLPGRGGTESHKPDKETQNSLEGAASVMATIDQMKLDVGQAFPQGTRLDVAITNLLNPTQLARLKTQYIDTMMKLKEAYNLGVLTGPDWDLLTLALAEPDKIFSTTTVQSFLLQAERLRGLMDNLFANSAIKMNYHPVELYQNRYSLQFYNQFRPQASAAPAAPAAPSLDPAAKAWREHQARMKQLENPFGR